MTALKKRTINWSMATSDSALLLLFVMLLCAITNIIVVYVINYDLIFSWACAFY